MSFLVLAALWGAGCAGAESPSAAAFFPGRVWLDTDGQPINAHGGSMLYHEGVYYWYGEIKEGPTWLPESNKIWDGTRVDVVGISCYSSQDLYHWKNEGNVLPSVTDDPANDLHPGKVVERPRVIYNRKTQTFVMWMHIDTEDYSAACSGVAVSDTPTGPFRYLGSFRPNAGVWPQNASESDKLVDGQALARDFAGGQMARDMTLFVDEDGTAYQFYSSEDNAVMHISELTDDYLQPSGRYQRVFVGRSMESPTVFGREGRYYLIASGCTGWTPNAARSASAESIWGPWEELGNPCRGKGAKTTFDAQGTFVFAVQGKKDAFIFMADRWNKDDLEDSGYVWLPLEFDEQGRVVLRWHDRWALDVFDSQD